MSGAEALKSGVRANLLSDSLLAPYVIGGAQLLPDDPLPAAEIIIHSAPPTETLGSNEAFLDTLFSVVWLGEDANGVSAVGSCDPLNERTRELLYVSENGESARDRFNRFLEPFGWTSDVLQKPTYIPEHRKQIGKDITDLRWTIGYFYSLHISRI